MALPVSQKRYVRLILVVAAIIFILLFFPFTRRRTAPEKSKSNWEHRRPDAARKNNSGKTNNEQSIGITIRNETLGFQKVFAINLPIRVDKWDNIVLASSVTDFRVERIEGITPDQTSPLTYPYNWNPKFKDAEYGARRAHVNIMQRIVDQRLGSALIMEDDADWDVSIKTQLQSFAFATRALQDQTELATPYSSPYGDDWDVLWIGHCGVECRTDLPVYLTHNDPTLLTSEQFLPYWRDPPPINRPEHARMTCTTNDGVCSVVYAVSYRGAQRILSALSVDPSGIAEKVDIGAPFDVSLGRLCQTEYLRCFSPYPSLTGGYRAAGNTAKGSDIHSEDDEEVDEEVDEEIEPAASRGVMYSTLMNVNRLLRGDKIVHSNQKEPEYPDVNPDDIPVVHGIIQSPEDSEPDSNSELRN